MPASRPASIPTAFARFFAHESAGGVVLALAAVAALGLSNSPWRDAYAALLRLPGELNLGGVVVLSKPLLLWVNDLWMAVFFFVVGLEVKRELLEGELSSRSQALLPVLAAVGGMAAPAAIYAAINLDDAVALRGWAIPAATDIAFSLGVVLLLGSRVPASLKVFLTAVAIADDLGAIVVIALFYTEHLSALGLAGAALGVALLLLLNRRGVGRADLYIAIGLAIWVCVLKSGVHATLAGVLTALAIPLRRRDGEPLAEPLEHALHPWVAFVILPVFAFANAGVSLQGVTPAAVADPVTLGIVLGLVAGKTIGVYGASWLAVRSGLAAWPDGASRRQFLGICVLCGIGFTMSLFIGALAFEGDAEHYATRVKLGVLAGSLLAAVLGTALLRRGER